MLLCYYHSITTTTTNRTKTTEMRDNCFQEIPVAIYNASEQKLIAVAKSMEQAALYVFGKNTSHTKLRNITNNVKHKRTILKCALGHKVAVRIATQEQIDMLQGSNIVLIK